MMQERLIELINNEIDGLNSASEHQELMQHIGADERAAKLYHDLLQTATALKGVEQLPAPSYLKTRVMNSIYATRTPAVQPGTWWSSWTAMFRRKPAARYAVVFASGLCVGLLFLVLATPWQQGGEPDASAVSGSMALFSNLHHLPVLDSARFEGEGVDGVFTLYKSGSGIYVEIEVHSSEVLRIELNSDPAALRFDGIRRTPRAEGDVNVTQGRITLTMVKSDGDVVAFSKVGDVQMPVEGRVYKRGVMIRSVSLRTR